MPRYVILTHDHPFPHWDLLLEAGGVCRTWRLLEEPQPGRVVEATASPDHRLLYLDYVGPVSGNRGTVARWDWGVYSSLQVSEDDWAVSLRGERGFTTAQYRRDDAGENWVFRTAASGRAGPAEGDVHC
ncbi:MAG: DNA polymerase ligase N-terminal domain-containing protein [Planctomycetaceae bacterium]